MLRVRVIETETSAAHNVAVPVELLGSPIYAKLRQDYKQQQGKAFSLRTFHDTLLGHGTAPFWLHRQLMLGGPDGADAGDLLE